MTLFWILCLVAAIVCPLINAFGQEHLYQKQVFLGRGMNAHVYKVQGPNGRISALKELSRMTNGSHELMTERDILLHFITDSHIIQLEDSFIRSSDNSTSLVLEYIDGQELFDYLQSQKLETFSLLERKRLMLDCALAVQQVHKKGICHNDIKPENFMVLSKPLPLMQQPTLLKLIDFGFARFSTTPMKIEGEGSINFMSSELIEKFVFHADGLVDCYKSDIWALGATFYSIMTLEMPFYSTLGKDYMLGAIWKGAYRRDPVLDENQDFEQLLRIMFNTNPEERADIDQVLAWFQG